MVWSVSCLFFGGLGVLGWVADACRVHAWDCGGDNRETLWSDDMTENNVVENRSNQKGTVKINVSPFVKEELIEIMQARQHTTMDSVVRELLRRPAERRRPTISDITVLEEQEQ